MLEKEQKVFIIKFSAILGTSRFIKDVNSTSVGWDGGGWWVAMHEVAGIIYVNTGNNQMASIGAIFTYKYRTKQLNPWQKSRCGKL